jgi:ABC-type glycerol-3-phosphate transport system permease component
MTFPLFWMVSGSFKSRGEIYKPPPTLLPQEWTTEGYKMLMYYTDFPAWFRNSLMVSVGASLFALVLGVGAIYGVARFRFIGGRVFTYIILITYMLPPILLVIPLYTFWVRIGLADSLLSLTFTYVTFTLPFALWMLRSYIETISPEMEEAAMVDGATRFQAFIKITLPQAVPGMIATFIFTFILAWNEYLYALVIISSESKKTVALGIGNLIGVKALFSWGMLNAAGVLATIPILLFFIFLQRRLVAGFSVGALKG